jgi:hypothetical protein
MTDYKIYFYTAA